MHEGIEKVGLPSTLLRLGRSFREIAACKQILAIKISDQDLYTEAKDFLLLHSEEWDIYRTHAMNTFGLKKNKMPEMLPLSSDLKTLRLFLLENIANITNSKETPLSYSKWIQLQK